MDEKEIDNFISAACDAYSTMDYKNMWPLNGAQMGAYFDSQEALDIYHRLLSLKGKLSLHEIAELLPPADVFRIFLLNNGIIGMKVAKIFKIENLSRQELIDYTLFLFELLGQKTHGDIFCRDKKNLILSPEEAGRIISSANWEFPKSFQEQRQIASLIVTANNFCYTLFFDSLMTGGFYIHGPYDACKRFGKDAILVIREYYNLNPKEIWPMLEMPFSKITICGVYKNIQFPINFTNHPLTTAGIADKLLAVRILVDGKQVPLSEVGKLTDLIERKSSKQSKAVQALDNLEKVKKAAEISFSFFKKLRGYFGDNTTPQEWVEQTISRVGREYLAKFDYKKNPPIEHWKKILDPRNDYLFFE